MSLIIVIAGRVTLALGKINCVGCVCTAAVLAALRTRFAGLRHTFWFSIGKVA